MEEIPLLLPDVERQSAHFGNHHHHPTHLQNSQSHDTSVANIYYPVHCKLSLILGSIINGVSSRSEGREI